ncbi:Sacsin [Manis pentadactyla]|nr:Sacsin [Manis pentadactyla]
MTCAKFARARLPKLCSPIKSLIPTKKSGLGFYTKQIAELKLGSQLLEDGIQTEDLGHPLGSLDKSAPQGWKQPRIQASGT